MTLTGRAAQLRPDINYLAPHPIVLVTPEQARADAYAKGASAETAGTLKTRGRMANMRRVAVKRQRDEAARQAAAERGVAWIPTSGSGRRRAKAIRNNEAAVAMVIAQAETKVAELYLRTHGGQHGELRLGAMAFPGLLAGPDLLAEILAWCNEHPATFPLNESGPLVMSRHEDGTITVEGDAPDILGISADLLAVASPEYVSFDDGILTLAVQPEPLYYRPLGPDPASYTVVFERIREA